MDERRPRHPRVRFLLRGTAITLSLIVGCKSDGGRGRSDDPLLGGSRPIQGVSGPISTPPPNAMASSAGSGATPATPTANVPSYQPKTPTMPASNAALAGGATAPLPGSDDLRIGGANANVAPPPGVKPVDAPNKATTQVNGGNSNSWEPVRPVPPPGAAGAAGAVTPTSGAGGVSPPPALSPLDQALAAVQARNPSWYRIKYNSQTREYLFDMSLPSRMNASVQRNVEGVGVSPAEAIQKALEQAGND